ncbi:zinc-ribbon domain-containing protein [Paenibacillus massiliensis]|uniref:zinc-ribbon domain-containing protein n=1 Tax=Paenibacillus massiliensis TaxID=225917 RepID=UPI0003828DE7|nr:zinc-ribbon domain-containing protein [Paenibacillus massiliensis]
MFCNSCGKTIIKSSRFCHHCGAEISIPELKAPPEPVSSKESITDVVKVESVIPVESTPEDLIHPSDTHTKPVNASKESAKSNEGTNRHAVPSKTPRSKKKLIAMILVATAALIVISGIVTSYLSQQKYTHAASLMSSGNYEQAIEEFKDLGDYKDSAVLLAKSNYLYATQLIKNKDYSQVKEIITDLELYKHIPEARLQMDYLEGLVSLNNSEYAKAIEAFERSGDYEDSKQQLIEAKYQHGKYLISGNNSAKALPLLQEIKEHRDTGTLLHEAQYLEGIRLFKEGDLTEAKARLTSIGDDNYKDTKKYLKEIGLLEPFQGTWQYGSGQQVIFSGLTIYTITWPGTYKQHVYDWKVIIEGNTVKNNAASTFVIKNGSLHEYRTFEGETDLTVFNKLSSSTTLPTAKILRNPAIGMTASEVRESSWGEPSDINRTTTSFGVSEQWVYSNYSGYRFIYLDDGIVTSIQE